MNRVCITGIGVISSIGTGKADFWQHLLDGKSGITAVKRFDTSKTGVEIGAEVPDFQPEKYGIESPSYLRAGQLAIAGASLAIADSGMCFSEISSTELSVCAGSTAGEVLDLEGYLKTAAKPSNFRMASYAADGQLPLCICEHFNMRKARPHHIPAACASGNYAVGYVADQIRLGRCEVGIAGGVDSFSILVFYGFHSLRSLDPDTCRPFDSARKGVVIGEGAAFFVLESESHAVSRKAHRYANVCGYGLSCVADNMITPKREGAELVMRNALKDARLSAVDIDWVCAHGTGTILNDVTEAEAIQNVFENRPVPVSSIKGHLGHAMGAASALETAACCMSIQTGKIPPTLNLKHQDPQCDINVVSRTTAQDVHYVLNNAFAFGANNCCLILGRP